MESPGEYLKRERGLRGISLDDVKSATRIQKKYLEALEADDYAQLPHPTFVKGFIKSYCKCLGVDENDAVLRYEIFIRESSAAARPIGHATAEATSAPPPEPEEEVARNTRNIILLVVAGVVIIIALYIAYSWEEGPAPRVAEKEPPPEASATTPKTPIATAYKPPKAEAPPRAEAAPRAEAPPGDLKKPAPVAMRKAPVKKPSAVPAPSVTAKPAPPAAPSTPVVPAAAPVLAVKEAKHTLLVEASERVWVQVSIDSGEPFDVILRQGESITWKAADGFALVVGNAGGVAMTFDGREYRGLGGPGKVVRLVFPRKQDAPGR